MANLGRYRTGSELDYAANRAAVLESIPSTTVADAPFLFATRQLVSELAVRMELFNLIRDISGSIVECGVAKGNNLLFFSHLSSIYEPYAINRRIVGFDTFEGFRSMGGTGDPQDISEKDFADTSDGLIRKAIDLYDANRAVGHMPRTEIVKGDAVETMPGYAAAHPELTVALLYCDFDLYKPTKVALETFLPLVCKGGVVAFDQFNYDRFAGETAAFKDQMPIGDARLRRFYFDPFVSYFIKE